MNKLSSILALILLAACDTEGSSTTTGGDGSSSAGSSSDALSETSGSGDSTGDESTGGSTTGEGSTGGTSGSGGEGMGSGTGEPEMCLGQSCERAACRDGLSCLPHPETGEPVCVSLCGAVGDACGASCIVGTELECLIIVGGPSACFPVV